MTNEEKLTRSFTVRVIGAEHDGHPINSININLAQASIIFDHYVKKYPNHTVQLIGSVESVVKETVGLLPTKCPQGHLSKHTLDGQPSIVETLPGIFQCKICGDRFKC